MTQKPSESLENLKMRVSRIETPSLTSPILSKFGWPMFALGVILWLLDLIIEGPNFFISIFGLLFIGSGVAIIAVSLITSHSEGVEDSERARLIRERSEVIRCLYLEGRVPEGRGSLGRCRLYDFDMVDKPYCIYCREYSPSKGKPDV